MSKSTFVPFSTIPPSDAMMRVGLGSMALHYLASSISSVERKRHYALIDSTDELNAKLSKTFDMNFMPLSAVRVYKKLSVPPHDSMGLLEIADLYTDTVVFDIMGRLPLEPDWQDLFSDGNYAHEATFLVFNQGGQSHFFLCGGEPGEDKVEQTLLDFGKIGTASLNDLKTQYTEIATVIEDDFDATQKKQAINHNWLLLNGLIANFNLTIVSISG